MTRFFKIGIDTKKTQIYEAELGIEIDHNGKRFVISRDNSGDLCISSTGREMIIKPKSGNRIELDSAE